MIRKTALFYIAAALFGSFGCAPESASVSASTVSAASDPAKILVVVYSWGGNTLHAAEQIQKASGGTLVEIKPVKPYSTDYKQCVDDAKKDIQAGVKPELTAMPDVAAYDIIFVGSPNWWGTMAPPLKTFLSAADLNGKTIIPFFTHGGGGMQNCERDVQALCTGSKLVKAATFSGSSIKSSDAEIASWVKSVLAAPSSGK